MDALAERKKIEGNNLFKLQNYWKAIELYNEAIDLCPNAIYYGNRSACYIKLGKHKQALTDALKSVYLDQQFRNGWIRVIKCNIILGDIVAVETAIANANGNGIFDLKEVIEYYKPMKNHYDKAKIAFEKEDFSTALSHYQDALEYAPLSTILKTLKAECLANLERFYDAEILVQEILKNEPENEEGLLILAICIYCNYGFNKSVTHFQYLFKISPDYQKGQDFYKKFKTLNQKLEKGRAAYETGNYNEAHSLYTEAIAINSNNAKLKIILYYQRAMVSDALGRYEDALIDCTEALALSPYGYDSLLLRAKCYYILELYEDAIQDCKVLQEHNQYFEVHYGSSSLEGYYAAYYLDAANRIKMPAWYGLVNSRKKDYFEILGLNENASPGEIRKTYKSLALHYHPDRHPGACKGVVKYLEGKFQQITKAYNVLLATVKPKK